VLIVADKQILCGSCGKLVGLEKRDDSDTVLFVVKDRYVVATPHPGRFFCNVTCKERAQV
jgi:hypothetical protein